MPPTAVTPLFRSGPLPVASVESQLARFGGQRTSPRLGVCRYVPGVDSGYDWSVEIDTVLAQVSEHYIFPDVAERVCRVLRCGLAAGAYCEASDDESFAEQVTRDLQSVNGDKHLRLLHSVDEIPEQEGPEVADQDRHRREAELAGHGFAKVDRLAGNVGLLDIRRLFAASISGDAAVAAMNLVAGADVLLIDLRHNGGGDPAMVALLCSYLFDDAVHLNDIYARADGRIRQYWTASFVPGPKFGGSKPIYLLTSGETFSGAEELCYDLQQVGRATLVGETTRGGAHPTRRHRVAPHLVAAVPCSRSVNPASGTNWEGVGVAPDVAVNADAAFDLAYALALEEVLALGAAGARRAIADQAHQELTERQ